MCQVLHRIIDLIDQHHPDLLYFDDVVFPLYPVSDIGLRIAAYLTTPVSRGAARWTRC